MQEPSLSALASEASQAYDRIAEGYTAPSHETVRNFEALILPFLDDRVGPAVRTGWRVLDLGGGRGYVANWFAKRGCRVILGDVSPEMLKWAMHDYGSSISYVHLSAFDLPFRDCLFDAVTTMLCGAYMRSEAVAEVRRVLKPGGIHIGAETPKPWAEAVIERRNMRPEQIWFKDGAGKDVLLPFRYTYTRPELTALLVQCGLSEEYAAILTPRGRITNESVSAVNRGVAESLGIAIEDIPMLLAWIARKPQP